MEVNFANGFFKSLKNVIARERWYWKLWDFIRYDFPKFIRNIWLFRKALWNYSWWRGQHSVLPFMKTALVDMAITIDERGHEVEESSSKKVAKMLRAAKLMEHFIEENFVEMAEDELGEIVHHPWEFEDVPNMPGYSRLVDKDTPEEEAHKRKVFERAREIEKEMWDELWYIMKGQDYSKFEPTPEGMDSNKSYEHFQSQVDGTGLNTWWD